MPYVPSPQPSSAPPLTFLASCYPPRTLKPNPTLSLPKPKCLTLHLKGKPESSRSRKCARTDSSCNRIAQASTKYHEREGGRDSILLATPMLQCHEREGGRDSILLATPMFQCPESILLGSTVISIEPHLLRFKVLRDLLLHAICMLVLIAGR